ncbi:MAG: pseudouridine synthase [Novosphingobium sp.]
MAEKQPKGAGAPPVERSGERIAKLLARAGVASRREVERMIGEGRIALNGNVLDTPATILPSLAGVTVDGKSVARPEPPRLFRFHKPAGLITAERDPAGRPTIYTALRNALPPGTPRLMPIGRLDLNTEGLLLLTNDGELKRAMELPSSGIPRTYRARTYGDVSQSQLEELMEGVTIDGMYYSRIDANMERRTGRNQWIELTLTEGKNREVRRVLEHLGLEVSRLLRTSYGPFHLLDLQRGQTAEIRQSDVERFRKSLKQAGPKPRVNPAPEGARQPPPRAKPHPARGDRGPGDAARKARPEGRGSGRPSRPAPRK